MYTVLKVHMILGQHAMLYPPLTTFLTGVWTRLCPAVQAFICFKQLLALWLIQGQQCILLP